MDPISFITPLNHESVPFHPFTTLQENHYTNDWLSILKEYNKNSISNRIVPGLAYVTNSSYADMAFKICHHFKQPSEVCYLTVDLFERFLMLHCKALHEHITANSSNPSVRKAQWKRVVQRCVKQSVLRLVSCMQLASKFHLHAKSVTNKSAHKYLVECGHGYSKESVCSSENRVYRTLDFKIPLYTSLTYVETLVDLLKDHVNADEFLSICNKVLDVVVIQHQEIYLRFFWMANNRWERTFHDREKFMAVEMDQILQAAAVVVSALQILHVQGSKAKSVCTRLGHLTDFMPKDIMALAVVITQIILGARVHVLVEDV